MEEFATFVGDAASLLPEGIKDFGLQVTGEEAEETLALVKAAATKPVCLILKTCEGAAGSTCPGGSLRRSRTSAWTPR